MLVPVLSAAVLAVLASGGFGVIVSRQNAAESSAREGAVAARSILSAQHVAEPAVVAPAPVLHATPLFAAVVASGKAVPKAATVTTTKTVAKPKVKAKPVAAEAPTLMLSASGATWFQVKKSGKVLAVGTLKKGGTRRFPGAGRYDILLGNSGNAIVDTGSGPKRAGAPGDSGVVRFQVR